MLRFLAALVALLVCLFLVASVFWRDALREGAEAVLRHYGAERAEIELSTVTSSELLLRKAAVSGVFGAVQLEAQARMLKWSYSPEKAWEGELGELAADKLELRLPSQKEIYRKIIFVQPDVTYSAASVYPLDITGPLLIRASALHLPGLSSNWKIENLRAAFDVEPGSFALGHLQAELIGADLVIGSIPLFPPPKKASFPMILKGLQLETLLALYPQKNLRGSGTLDAVLPVFLTEAGVVVRGGHVKARPPGGVLKLSSEALENAGARLSASLQIPQEVLKDYHYTTLDVDVSLERDGTLLLKIKLRGRNPEYRQGVPVNININLEDNIPALLQSVEALGGFRQSLESGLVRE